MSKLSLHFDSSEFACRCGCGAQEVSPKLISLLENIRSRAGGLPITVVSGRRCAKRNADVGGARHSQHLLGTAADIKIKNMSPEDVHALISEMHQRNLAHVGGLGLYKTFVHVDVRDGVARWGQ